MTSSATSPDPPDVVLDSADPLNLIIHNSAMDESSDSTGSPPDWSQLNSLWPEQDPGNPNANTKSFNDFMDFNMASNILDMDLDMALNGSGGAGIEPSALHLDPARLAYGSYDDLFTSFPASASPADILTAQFPFNLHNEHLTDINPSTISTPGTKQRRLSITSSSSSSGPSFSPAPESIPSPEYLGSGNGYTSDSTQQSFSNSVDQSPTTSPVTATVTDARSGAPLFSNDPAAELAHRVRQSAGVMLAVPMNGSLFQANQFLSSSGTLQTKLPIPRLQRPSISSSAGSIAANSPPKSGSSAASSAASTPPPSTPPPSTANNHADGSLTSSPTSSSGPSVSLPAQSSGSRPKTSHTTIERRYRTNLNARIQSLRMAVPALRVLEDRDNGSSKKIKKNLKGGVLIKSGSANSPNGVGTVIAVPGEPTPSNPYGEVDVIDERGYVDGVKVARKCSKANVLGKAVEYIRVLKRRETRLKAEQAGLKSLVSGLVGGPALLREWEREWRERFGGEERDEVDGEGDIEDEGDDDDDDDDDDEEGETGRKRKRAKAEKDVLSLPKKEAKPVSPITLNADGQPEKRRRGRPRKVPLPPANPAPVVASTTSAEQPQQQYLLAAFALFSFFNSPFTSAPASTASAASHTHKGHVLNPAPLPLAYAPEILSQLTPPVTEAVTTSTWRDWVQVVHQIVTILLFLSVLSRMAGGFGLGRVRRFMKVALGTTREADVDKKVEKIILGAEPSPSFTSAMTLYRSIPNTASPVIKALFLFTIASSPSSTPYLAARIFKMYARSVWSRASACQRTKTEDVILGVTIDEAYDMLPSLTSENKGPLVELLAAHIIKLKLGHAMSKLFVREVNGEEAQEAQESTSDLECVIKAAKELGGDVGVLAQNVERVSSASVTSSPSAESSEADSDNEDDWDGSTSLSRSITSEDDIDDKEWEYQVETDTPFAILRALVLYRSLFTAPPTVSVEPPTPTTAIPSTNVATIGATQRRMYALRKLLGNRVFDVDEVEDARDKVVDLLVEAERRTRVRSALRV